jgi:hypothetical protein
VARLEDPRVQAWLLEPEAESFECVPTLLASLRLCGAAVRMRHD